MCVCSFYVWGEFLNDTGGFGEFVVVLVLEIGHWNVSFKSGSG